MATIEKILEEFKDKTLTADQKQVIKDALNSEYKWGDQMKEPCPQCNHPLMNTFGWGPVCLKSEGGCSYVWNEGLQNLLLPK